MFTVLLFFTTLIQIDEGTSFNVRPENDYDSVDRYETLEDRNERVYQMLMNYEQQKNERLKTSNSNEVFSELFVIKANGTGWVKDVSEKYGFAFIRKVFEEEDFYLIRRTKCRKRCKRRTREFFRDIVQYPEIRWTVQQSLQDRYRRISPGISKKDDDGHNLLSETKERVFEEINKIPKNRLKFNDPLFQEQWYLYNWGQTESSPVNDINVYPVWQSGITGRGVVVSVLDDGVDGRSEEVADNYDLKSSEDYLFQSPFHPIAENSHGTRCAAIAAGVANNGVCGVGVAYEAKVGGIRLLDDSLTDVQEALALVHASDHVNIYTASWGPSDQGTEVDGPRILTRMALVKGVTMGRRGKGSIYVWAAGNGGGYYDTCSLDGYASSPFTLTIGALTEEGLSTFYSEPCPAVIASAYVGGKSHEMPSRESWKKDKEKIKVIVPEGRGKCRETFQGTSAAAPMAAGVIALLLQANPDLTWRDVQHLIVRTSRVPDTTETGWLTNGAGFRFHPKIGSGVLDAHALVTLARKWTLVADLRIWKTPAKRRKRLLFPKQTTTIYVRILKLSMQEQNRIGEIETVITTISVRHGRRGDLEMVLESPSGTPSPILTVRPHDNRTAGFDHWDFVSLHFWGEDPEGVWKLKILNHNERITGIIDYVSITLFGTRNS